MITNRAPRPAIATAAPRAAYIDFSEASEEAALLAQKQRAEQEIATRVGIVVTGDNHLSAHLPRLTPQRRMARRERLRAGFAAAVVCAIERKARLFVQAGDLFDTPTPSNEDRAFVAHELTRLRQAGIVAVGIGGNHDTPRMLTEHGGTSPQRVYAALGGLRYFPRNDALIPELLHLGGLRLAVVGLSNNPTAAPGSDPLASIAVADAEHVLASADIGLLILHAGIEGLCRPNEGERVVMRASLEALPDIFRVIVAGHIHRFGQQRIDERAAIVCGATERMEFGGQSGTSGFAWLEVGREGLLHAEHVRVQEQPRAEVTLSTAQLWPASADARELPPAADVARDDTAPDDMGNDAVELSSMRQRPDTLWGMGKPHAARHDPMGVIRRTLAGVCTPETMVRLRLYGSLTLDQYHQLALRDVLHYGQEHAFSLDVETQGLTLIEPLRTPTSSAGGSGTISPVDEVEALLSERISRQAGRGNVADVDLRAAADLMIGRLRGAVEQEAGQ